MIIKMESQGIRDLLNRYSLNELKDIYTVFDRKYDSKHITKLFRGADHDQYLDRKNQVFDRYVRMYIHHDKTDYSNDLSELFGQRLILNGVTYTN